MRDGFSSEVFLFLNEIEYIKFTQETNLKIPSMIGNLKIKYFSQIKYFLGLESESDAVLKLVHTEFGAEVRDFYLKCELRQGSFDSPLLSNKTFDPSLPLTYIFDGIEILKV